MAYVNGILTSVVRPALGPVEVTTEQQMADFAPEWVVVAQIPGGGSRVDPRFPPTRQAAQVDGYAKGSSRRAQQLCQAGVDALVAAWRRQVVTPDGTIATLNDVTDPSPLPGPASDVYRYVASLQITVR